MSTPDSRHGIVVRAMADFREVYDGAERMPCRLRGRLKSEGVLVGDRVRYRPGSAGVGVIEERLPRTNELKRPPVANVDCALVVASLGHPKVLPRSVDRLLCLIVHAKVSPILVLNKIDLAQADEIADWQAAYQGVWPLFMCSAKLGAGVRELEQQALQEGVVVLAGPTGVGKSSLFLSLQPQAPAEVGGLDRLGHGRHTTRSTVLWRLPGGALIADTPGFSALDLEGLTPRDVLRSFPEIEAFAADCRFADCRHLVEPDCAVREQVAAGRLHGGRYASYAILTRETIQAGDRFS